jgi:hypothetical protein
MPERVIKTIQNLIFEIITVLSFIMIFFPASHAYTSYPDMDIPAIPTPETNTPPPEKQSSWDNLITLGWFFSASDPAGLNLELKYCRSLGKNFSTSASMMYSYEKIQDVYGKKETSRYNGALQFDIYPFGDAMQGFFIGLMAGLYYNNTTRNNAPAPYGAYWNGILEAPHLGYRWIHGAGIIFDIMLGLELSASCFRFHTSMGYAF